MPREGGATQRDRVLAGFKVLPCPTYRLGWYPAPTPLLLACPRQKLGFSQTSCAGVASPEPWGHRRQCKPQGRPARLADEQDVNSVTATGAGQSEASWPFPLTTSSAVPTPELREPRRPVATARINTKALWTETQMGRSKLLFLV